MQVWKYTLKQVGTTTLEMPPFGKVLTCQMQRGQLSLWVLVNPTNSKLPRRFIVVGTGHNFAEYLHQKDLAYIDTIQMAEGSLVFHVFEILTP